MQRICDGVQICSIQMYSNINTRLSYILYISAALDIESLSVYIYRLYSGVRDVIGLAPRRQHITYLYYIPKILDSFPV